MRHPVRNSQRDDFWRSARNAISDGKPFNNVRFLRTPGHARLNPRTGLLIHKETISTTIGQYDFPSRLFLQKGDAKRKPNARSTDKSKNWTPIDCNQWAMSARQLTNKVSPGPKN